MKLRLSTIGINTTSFPAILVTDTGMQVMAELEHVRRAKFEAQQYLSELSKLESSLASDSIIEQDARVDSYLAGKQSPVEVAG